MQTVRIVISSWSTCISKFTKNLVQNIENQAELKNLDYSAD